MFLNNFSNCSHSQCVSQMTYSTYICFFLFKQTNLTDIWEMNLCFYFYKIIFESEIPVVVELVFELLFAASFKRLVQLDRSCSDKKLHLMYDFDLNKIANSAKLWETKWWYAAAVRNKWSQFNSLLVDPNLCQFIL